LKEYNKHSLIEALASLPEYDPPTSVWEKMERELKLHNNIANLKEHNPPSEVWTNLQNELVLQNAVAALSSYEPPSAIWEEIQGELATRKPKGRVVPLQRWIRYAAAAAVIGVVTLFGLSQFTENTITNSQLSYSVETVSDDLLKKDWNEDEDAFDYLMAICKEKVLACKNPEFQILQTELQELNDAKTMLEEAIGSYGTNANLISEMKDIEFARTTIVKQMIDVIS